MVRAIPERSGYEAMWLMAMFDLPVDSPKARRAYTRFRKRLLNEGFAQLQYSVYGRHCASVDLANRVCKVLKKAMPKEGQVRLLMVTERQFGKMQVYEGKKRIETEQPPAQYELF
ncbi:MAG: CRISPR-associated endonuclease Cas2 [Phycisphaeraceae bacterium]